MYFLVAEISAMAAFHDFQPPDLRPDHPQRWRSFVKVGVKWMQIAMAPSTWMNFRCSSASERWTGGVPASWVGGRNGEGCEVRVRPKGFLKVFSHWEGGGWLRSVLFSIVFFLKKTPSSGLARQRDPLF